MYYKIILPLYLPNIVVTMVTQQKRLDGKTKDYNTNRLPIIVIISAEFGICVSQVKKS